MILAKLNSSFQRERSRTQIKNISKANSFNLTQLQRQHRGNNLKSSQTKSRVMGTFSSSQKVPVYNKNNLSTILAADIGGTNARFQIWLLSSDGLNDVLLTEQEFKCKDFPTFELCVSELLKSSGVSNIDHACLAVAGPVKANSCQVNFFEQKS